MKITKRQLKKIIREEYRRILKESSNWGGPGSTKSAREIDRMGDHSWDTRYDTGEGWSERQAIMIEEWVQQAVAMMEARGDVGGPRIKNKIKDLISASGEEELLYFKTVYDTAVEQYLSNQV